MKIELLFDNVWIDKQKKRVQESLLKRFKDGLKEKKKAVKKIRMKLKKYKDEKAGLKSDRDYLFGSKSEAESKKRSTKLDLEAEINEAVGETDAIIG